MRSSSSGGGYRLGLAVAALALLAAEGGHGQEGVSSDEKTWSRRPAGAGEYQIVLEVSGRNELFRFNTPPSDTRSLRSICEARREAIATAFPTLEEHLEFLRSPGRGSDATDLIWTHHDLGQLWGYLGRMDKSIPELEAAYRIAVESPREVRYQNAQAYLEAVLGVLHLRRGELENCVHDKNASRCIFPIRGPGEHVQTAGSEAAIDYFLRHLRRQPDNLEIRWLLNVAYMTLGRHPGDVPAEHLIPPEAFASAEDPGRFADIAHRTGLDAPGRAGGAMVDDVDGDGLFDVVISSTDPCASLRYYHNEGHGTFLERTEKAGLSEQLGGINVGQTDYNNDGRLDLFVMRGGWELPMRNSLLRQNVDGTFTDVTIEAGLARSVHRTHSAPWADFDNDGWLDLFVGHEESPSALFHNQGDGTFVDVARKAGVDQNVFTKGATWGDYDNDGRMDLYVSNYGDENFLYHNEGDGTFRDVAKAKDVQKPIMSFATWFWDYDNDGWLDLFVANFVPSVTEIARGFLGLPRQAETMRLYRNDRRGGFENVTAGVGLERVIPTMGANFGDLDNDGFLDFYLGTGAPSYAALMPNIMFWNRGGRRFVDVTTATGTGHLQKGHGVAFADVDNDGDQDVYENIGGFVKGDEYSKVLFENPGHGNNWVRLRLTGVRSNRPAIGARIKVVVSHDGGEIAEYHRMVGSGGSFGASPLAQQIGLGRGGRIQTLEVYWPASRTRQSFRDVPVDGCFSLKEGEQRLTPLACPRW